MDFLYANEHGELDIGVSHFTHLWHHFVKRKTTSIGFLHFSQQLQGTAGGPIEIAASHIRPSKLYWPLLMRF